MHCLASQGWEVDPAETLLLLCQALLVLHAGLPSTTASASSKPPSSRHRHAPAALPATALLSQLQVLSAAIAAIAAVCRPPPSQPPAHPPSLPSSCEAAVLVLADLLSLLYLRGSSPSSSDPAAEARLSAAGLAAASALHHLLLAGHVHPEAPGLLPPLMACLPKLLLLQPGGSSGPADADGGGVTSVALLILDDMCRSRRIAAHVVRDTAVAQALVSLHLLAPRSALGAADGTGLLDLLLVRLRPHNAFHALKKAFPDPEDSDGGTGGGDDSVPLEQEMGQGQAEGESEVDTPSS